MDAPLPSDLVERWQEFFRVRPETSEWPLEMGLEVFGDPILFPLQRRREMEKMLDLARGVKPSVIFEIGSDKGGSLLQWCLMRPQRVIACEIRGTPFSAVFEAAFPDIKFLWLPQSSYDDGTVRQVRDWLAGDFIDVLFIDGDKGAFLTDFYLYLPSMSADGVVFMHDIYDPGPRDAWAEVQKMPYQSHEICDTSESTQAVDRAKSGAPPISAYEGWLRHWKGASCRVGVIPM